MNSASSGRAPFSIRRTILFGALAVGTTDILWAILMNGIEGKSAVWVLQSVAGGWFGPATFDGGLPTALVGMLTHYTIATCWFSAYYLMSRRFPELVRRWWLWGPLYGLLVWALMYGVVLPNSAYHTKGIRINANTWKQVFIHLFGVGMLAAYISRKGNPPQGA